MKSHGVGSRRVLRMSHTALESLSPSRNRGGRVKWEGNEKGSAFHLNAGGTDVAIE